VTPSYTLRGHGGNNLWQSCHHEFATYGRAMAILVDPAIWPWRGRTWAHLVSDTSYEELHDFAGRLGVPRRVFQGDHYDVPEDLRARAVALGAEPVTCRELVTRLAAAGLRRPRAPHRT
jgi:hypothetical protein